MRAALIALAFLPLPAWADCSAPSDQAEMTACADLAYQAADQDLNATYKLAMTAMKQWDADLPKTSRGAEDALRKAQRAWLPYRDAVCENEVFFYQDGSIAPLVRLACLERITRQRSEELRAMAEGE